MIYDSVVLVSHSLKCVPSFCENLSNQLIASFLSRDHPRSQGSAFGVGYHLGYVFKVRHKPRKQ